MLLRHRWDGVFGPRLNYRRQCCRAIVGEPRGQLLFLMLLKKYTYAVFIKQDRNNTDCSLMKQSMAVSIQSPLSRPYNMRHLQVTIEHIVVLGRNNDLVVYQVIPLKGSKIRATLTIVSRAEGGTMAWSYLLQVSYLLEPLL